MGARAAGGQSTPEAAPRGGEGGGKHARQAGLSGGNHGASVTGPGFLSQPHARWGGSRLPAAVLHRLPRRQEHRGGLGAGAGSPASSCLNTPPPPFTPPPLSKPAAGPSVWRGAHPAEGNGLGHRRVCSSERLLPFPRGVPRPRSPPPAGSCRPPYLGSGAAAPPQRDAAGENGVSPPPRPRPPPHSPGRHQPRSAPAVPGTAGKPRLRPGEGKRRRVRGFPRSPPAKTGRGVVVLGVLPSLPLPGSGLGTPLPAFPCPARRAGRAAGLGGSGRDPAGPGRRSRPASRYRFQPGADSI